MVATKAELTSSDSCFASQVEALLTNDATEALEVKTVLIEKQSFGNTVLDSGSEAQVELDKEDNAFRATPIPVKHSILNEFS